MSWLKQSRNFALFRSYANKRAAIKKSPPLSAGFLLLDCGICIVSLTFKPLRQSTRLHYRHALAYGSGVFLMHGLLFLYVDNSDRYWPNNVYHQ